MHSSSVMRASETHFMGAGTMFSSSPSWRGKRKVLSTCSWLEGAVSILLWEAEDKLMNGIEKNKQRAGAEAAEAQRKQSLREENHRRALTLVG